MRTRLCLMGMGVLLAGLSACTPTPEAAPESEERIERPQETLIGGTAERLLLARAIYPEGTLRREVVEFQALPERLWVVIVNPNLNDGVRTWLQDMFGVPMRDVPVSDGQWLAAVLTDGSVWLTNLDEEGHQQLPLGGEGTDVRLWALRHPWLVGQDEAGVFAMDVVTGGRVELPRIRPRSVALLNNYVGYITASENGSDPGEIQVTDLTTGQASKVADATRFAGIYAETFYFTYVRYDSKTGTYHIRSYRPETGATQSLAQTRREPIPGETQEMVAVSPYGYIFLTHGPNFANVWCETIHILRRSGQRDLYAQFVEAAEAPWNAPAVIANCMVFVDRNDGAWTFAHMDTGRSLRIFPFSSLD